MAHTIEPAASARAKCRACGTAIAKGELRFGERLPNPFAEEGEMTLWFHLTCGAYKRPEALLEALAACELDVERRAWLLDTAHNGIEHRRLPRVDGAERAPTGRAACRSCRAPIDKDTWRIRLVFFEDGRFNPSGFIHATCAGAYLETTDVLERLVHFNPDLSAQDQQSLARSLGVA